MGIVEGLEAVTSIRTAGSVATAIPGADACVRCRRRGGGEGGDGGTCGRMVSGRWKTSGKGGNAYDAE